MKVPFGSPIAVPAKAGTHLAAVPIFSQGAELQPFETWIPAGAGTTIWVPVIKHA
jgi:hypothetical protein